MKTYDFPKDLDKGQQAEVWFHKMHEGFLTRTDGKSGDFIHANGEKVELKSEFYVTASPAGRAMEFRRSMLIPNPPDGWTTTPNLAVEEYSSASAGTPGGPWQARAHDAKYYVHFFVGDGMVFAYRTDDMLNFMENSLDKKYKKFQCDNSRYITTGFLVPRAHVKHLEINLFG